MAAGQVKDAEGSTTPEPIRGKPVRVDNTRIVSSEIGNLFWLLFWLEGGLHPKHGEGVATIVAQIIERWHFN